SDFEPKGNKLVPPVAEKPEKSKNHHIQTEDTAHKKAHKDDALIIFGEYSNNSQYKLAQCCKPIPGDAVFGFVTSSGGLTIHRTNCPNAAQLLSNYGHRVVKTKWAKNKEISFLSGVKVIGLDNVGIIRDMTNLVTDGLKVNIAALSIESKEGIFEGEMKVYIHEKEELDEIVEGLEKVEGVQSVTRLEPEE